LIMSSPLSVLAMFLHSPLNAFLAAATALLMSSAVPASTEQISLSLL
jgi:hypothetical protein